MRAPHERARLRRHAECATCCRVHADMRRLRDCRHLICRTCADTFRCGVCRRSFARYPPPAEDVILDLAAMFVSARNVRGRRAVSRVGDTERQSLPADSEAEASEAEASDAMSSGTEAGEVADCDMDDVRAAMERRARDITFYRSYKEALERELKTASSKSALTYCRCDLVCVQKHAHSTGDAFYGCPRYAGRGTGCGFFRRV